MSTQSHFVKRPNHVGQRTAGIMQRTWLPMILVLVSIQVGYAAPKPKILKPPTAAQIEATVFKYFTSQKDFKQGDLITQSQTKKLLVAMDKHGWRVPDAKDLLDRVLEDDNYLVKEFNTVKGREFMNKIKDFPGGIDRMDRIARMPHGKVNVHDLINKIPNGDDWIRGMTTTKRGQRMGDRLSTAPTGKNFNEPTGRIYTVEDLVQALNESFHPKTR